MLKYRWPSGLLLLCTTLFASGCTVRTDLYDLDGHDVELVFMHTGDIHSRLVPYPLDVGEVDAQLGLLQENGPFGGIARLSTIIRQERDNNERVAYVETGDAFQGAPIFNVFAGEPEFMALTQLGVDAFAIGNHEFDNGSAHLVSQARAFANFPMLAVNYLLEPPTLEGNADTGLITEPYTIVNMKGLRVGIIGLGNLGSMRSVFKGGNSMGITPLHTVDTLQSYVDFLRPQVDLVVSIGHIGYHDDLDVIPRVEGLDIVFGGHLHIALDPPNVIQDCDIAKLQRERDRYICDTEEKLRQAETACQAQNACSTKDPAAAAQCEADCKTEVIAACKQETESSRYKQRLAELDHDIERLEKRGCHPRNVVLVHSGAFLKFAGRLQVTVRQCTRLEAREVCTAFDAAGNCITKRPRRCVGRNGGDDDWEVLAHSYKLIPIDATIPEDPKMLRLIEPYVVELNRQEKLTQLIGYTSARVRRFSTGSGDSQVGNIVADAMQLRNQVWADFAVTNSLGIRSDLVIGPIDREQMTNVFPFENAIAVMYLSGFEVQELMDFITQRSTNRGCQSQAQVAGITAVLNCGGCAGDGGNTCLSAGAKYDGEACAQRVTVGGTGRPCKVDADCDTCKVDSGAPAAVQAAQRAACSGKENQQIGEICTGQLHPEFGDYKRCWAPIGVELEDGTTRGSCARSFKLATNDYIATGGSGFQVLERNTTQQNLGISLRQAAVDFMRSMPACGERSTPTGSLIGQSRTFLVTEADEKRLKELEDVAKGDTPNDVRAGLLEFRKELEKRSDATNDPPSKAGYNGYLRCADLSCQCATKSDCGSGETCTNGFCLRNGLTRCQGLASKVLVDCETVQNKARCDALGRVHAAMRCVTLPCINAREDGRLQRIFKASTGSPNPFEPWPE